MKTYFKKAVIMSQIIMVYTTVPSEEQSKTIVASLLEKRLIACATIFPCQSMYWWNDTIQNDHEWIIIAKTEDILFSPVEQEITRLHSYECPCIIKINGIANIPYAQWVSKEVRAS